MSSKKIVVFRAYPPEERRVAMTPLAAKKLMALGWDVGIQCGAGAQAGFSDESYEAVGVQTSRDLESVAKNASVALFILPPTLDQMAVLSPSCALVGLLGGHAAPEYVKTHPAYSLERLPRTSGAQTMDVLTSQSSLYGYWAVLDGARRLPRVMPMMTTPSGRLNPAQVLVLGAGVAGLQAMATAKRLGAVVSAFDVRESARGAVESLDCQFYRVTEEDFLSEVPKDFASLVKGEKGGLRDLEDPSPTDASSRGGKDPSMGAAISKGRDGVVLSSLDVSEAPGKAGEGRGGYAQGVDAAMLRAQRHLIGELLLKTNLVIATAMVPFQEPPVLITRSMVEKMPFGSVIMDLATDRWGAPLGASGNCNLSRRGETQILHGVTLVGTSYGLSAMALDASNMFANNLLAFLKYAWDDTLGNINDSLDLVAPLRL